MEAPHSPDPAAPVGSAAGDSEPGETDIRRWLFPRWTNKTPILVLALVTGGAVTAGAAITYYGTDKHFSVGYQPTQPIDYSHKLHAGDMGMDCRYCHVNVEKGPAATVPPTQTCMNCHWKVKTDSLKLLPLRESFASGTALPWIRVHKLPDYVYFDHSAHVTAGVGCSSCHGRVDQMPKVTQVQPLSMGWCLDCHRQPGNHLRDLATTSITDMTWQPKTDAPVIAAGPADNYYGKTHADGPVTKTGRKVSPPLHCGGCHR